MESVREEFLQLICDKTKSSEDIYNIMLNNHRDLFCTKKILREYKSWNNCIYQGSIGENDYIVSEPLSSSLDEENVEMIYDVHKELIIKFIDFFRVEYEKNPNNQIIPTILKHANKFLDQFFADSSISINNARKNISEYNKRNLVKQYNISSQIGENKTSVCCERNVSIGNIFQFVGYETYHIAGYTYCKEDDDKDAGVDYIFTLIKYGKDNKYALLDIFNGIVVPNVLPGDYDFTNGFTIECRLKENQTIIYALDGPLYEMTDEILQIETNIRGLNKKLEVAESKYKNNLVVADELRIEVIKEEFLRLLNLIGDSHLNVVFKNRYINFINDLCMDKIDLIEKQLKNKEGILQK